MIAILPNGIELSYEESGQGIPLLFIHGWPHNSLLWAAQLSGLQTQARCIAPDLRGFGNTTVTGPSTIDQYADDLASFITLVGLERVVVCGLSMGGYVALSLLRHHRRLLRGLILVSTRAEGDTPDARVRRMRLIEFIREHGVEALAAKQLRAMLGETTFNTRPDVVEALRQLMASAPAEGVIGGLQAMADRADSTDLLEGIDIPTLVVSGLEDTFTVPVSMRALAAAIPNSRLEVIPNGGHVCSYERPAAFNHIVGEFLASLLYD